MTIYNYVILADDQGDIVKHFKAVKYAPGYERTDQFKVTAGGGIDQSAGIIIKTLNYTFRVPAAASDPDGTLDDLIALFELINPTPTLGQPSNLLTLVDHYGATHYVKFREGTVPEPLTTQLEGPNAWHFVPVVFIIIPNAGGSGS